MQKHYATKASSQVRVKKRKNCPSLAPRYATIARHLNVVKIILHGTFDGEKVKYVSDAGALLKRRWCILNGIVLPWRRRMLQLRTMFILTNFLYYFDLSYNN